ncbi:MAG: hypothetical protein Q7S68_03125, partial [Deltaproteobacteria bacterium]|nr:hypothetical protein [Deltaproteobacteria bacterium]
ASGMAATLMGLILWLPMAKGLWLKPDQSFWMQSLQLLVAVGVGMVFYFGCGALLRIKEAGETVALLRKKLFR